MAIDHADTNLIHLPEDMEYTTAASLGCRFATSFRAVVDQGLVSAGQWVAVHGCGGVGLSAVMIANALGANVIAVDISDEALALAKQMGAAVTLNANDVADVAEAIHEITQGGARIAGCIRAPDYGGELGQVAQAIRPSCAGGLIAGGSIDASDPDGSSRGA